MLSYSGLILMALSLTASAQPTNGIVALSSSSVLTGDSVHSGVWRFQAAQPPQELTGDKPFPCRWITQGLDGVFYAETLTKDEQGSTETVFKLDKEGSNPSLVTSAGEGTFGVFAVDRKGEIIHQSRGGLQSWVGGQTTAFRKSGRVARHEPGLGEIRAFAWGPGDELFLADEARVRKVGADGQIRTVATLTGRVTDSFYASPKRTPVIWGLAVDGAGRVLVAVPAIGEVLRLEPDRTLTVVARSEDDGWAATGVAESGGTIFLLESKTQSGITFGPRVRSISSDGQVATLGVAN